MGNSVRIATIHHNLVVSENDFTITDVEMTYFTNYFEFDLDAIGDSEQQVYVIPQMACKTIPVIEPSSPNCIFVPSLTKSIRSGPFDAKRDDWTFRLSRGVGLQVFCFGKGRGLERLKLPPFPDACDVVLQFESNALIQVFTEESVRKRAVIHHLA